METHPHPISPSCFEGPGLASSCSTTLLCLRMFSGCWSLLCPLTGRGAWQGDGGESGGRGGGEGGGGAWSHMLWEKPSASDWRPGVQVPQLPHLSDASVLGCVFNTKSPGSSGQIPGCPQTQLASWQALTCFLSCPPPPSHPRFLPDRKCIKRIPAPGPLPRLFHHSNPCLRISFWISFHPQSNLSVPSILLINISNSFLSLTATSLVQAANISAWQWQ